MTSLTLFVLVGDDMRVLVFDKSADPVFDSITLFSIVVFSVEILYSSLSKDDYLFGFWFLADVFATVSLVLDLAFVADSMDRPSEISSENVDSARIGIAQSEYARAGRSSRVGSRVARLLRAARFLRIGQVLQRISSLRALWGFGPAVEPTEPGLAVDMEEFSDLPQEESRVGRKLSEKTTQRVICLTLAMLFSVPPLTVGDSSALMGTSAVFGADLVFSTWKNYEVAVDGGASVQLQLQRRVEWERELLMYILYHTFGGRCESSGQCSIDWLYKLCWVGYLRNARATLDPDALNMSREAYVQVLSDFDGSLSGQNNSGSKWSTMIKSIPPDVVDALKMPWTTDCSEARSQVVGVSLVPGVDCPRRAWRLRETDWFVPQLYSDAYLSARIQGLFVFVFDTRSVYTWMSIMSILQMVMVVFVLSTAAMSFSHDVDALVLHPIERMIAQVEVIRKDPLYAIRLGRHKDEANLPNLFNIAEAFSHQCPTTTKGKAAAAVSKREPMETKILENTIIKLGSLLAIGFGEAGVAIIGSNLDSDNARVNAMIPGVRVEAIYGFCSVRHFAFITEVLQENTMVFVNQVAEIVHTIVHRYLGSANRNAGAGFFLVWNVGRCAGNLRPKVADLAVMSFVQVVVQLNRCRKLAAYRGHPALLARLPCFRVALGFALHLGWAIEGAIGSEFKIDASYLSPHVNMASKLEAATAEYGVSLLVSEPLAAACSMDFSSCFRAVDCVRFQGFTLPTRLFTVDMCPLTLDVESNFSTPWYRNCTPDNEEHDRDWVRAQALEGDYQVHEEFENDKLVKRLREPFSLDFFQVFEKGYLNYEAGEWDIAQQAFSHTCSMLRTRTPSGGIHYDDGPSSCLLRFMELHDFQAPPRWPGYRDLDI